MEFEKSLFRVYERSVGAFFPSGGTVLNHEVTPTTSALAPPPSQSPPPLVSTQPQQHDRTRGWWLRYFTTWFDRPPKSLREWAVLVLALFKYCAVGLFLLLLLLHVTFGEGLSKGSCLKNALAQQYNVDVSLPVEISNSTNGSELYQSAEEGNANNNNNKLHPLLSDDLILVRVTKDDDNAIITATVVDGEEKEENLHLISTLPSSLAVNKPMYEFGTDPSYVLMNEHDRVRHQVRLLNVTVSLQCLVRSNGVITSFLSKTVGYDVYVINEFVHAIHHEGILRNLETHETFSWNKDTFEHITKPSWWASFAYKIRMVFLSMLLLFLISSVTSLVVRVLISSGVVFMFPLFQLFRSLGYSMFENRFLTLSYPWLGADIEVLEHANIPHTLFVFAHITWVLLCYSAYEACQITWKRFFYSFKPFPEDLEILVFGYLMLCEYFLLIYARSLCTLNYLPRFIALGFLAFHLYAFFSVYGYCNLAFALLMMSTMYWLLYFVLHSEVNALRRGIISTDTPRAAFTLLPSPQFLTSLSPIYSIFHPLNRVHREAFEEHQTLSRELVTDHEANPGGESEVRNILLGNANNVHRRARR